MENETSAEYWIENLSLFKHPEGGYYREIYRSEELISREHLPERYSGTRAFATSIYFLLKSDDFSAFHKILSDEIWTIIDGCTTEIFCISEGGSLVKHLLGKNVKSGELPQILINKNTWFGAKLIEKNSFILVNCFVSPGFSFDDFELAKRKNLISRYPLHKDIIIRLTPPDFVL